jgi:uncharacterized protein with ParB-like and HNH nuclease domain
MINATKETLNSFFSQSLQYVVPFFQRSYVWDKDNWELLWEHLMKITELSRNNIKTEHFIGTLITKQQESQRIGEYKLDLIDGQQRLTTFSLLLKAIATTAKGDGDFKKLKDRTNELIVFEDSKGNKFIRIEHSKNDQEYFDAVLLDKDLAGLANQEHKILRAYQYFLSELKDFSDEQLDNLRNVILNNVPVISMLLSANDDEQEIFDTINSLGIRLTTGELLKNFIFKEKALRNLYETHWYPVFEEDDDVINFWNREKTAGRIKRNNLELLLYCYLIIKTKTEVKLEELFKEYKKWITGKTVEEKKEFLQGLKEYATIYRNFPEGTQLNEIAFAENEKRFFHVIENLEITTVYPLVLYIYNKFSSEEVRSESIKYLESYLVRRNVCRLTTKNYNNIFIQIIRSLDESGVPENDSLKNVLMAFTEDTNRFPNDAEFATAFSQEALSHANAREILFCIAIYQLNSDYADIKKLSSASYSLEHILPQKWETNWSVNGMDETFKLQRNKKLKTLGNLTLVTKALNSKLKNSAWTNKKIPLKEYSKLPITTPYLDLNDWNEAEIEKRANDLSNAALSIWEK